MEPTLLTPHDVRPSTRPSCASTYPVIASCMRIWLGLLLTPEGWSYPQRGVADRLWGAR